ncbi:MAG: DUF4249 domain-containing protein [Bacteroidia bacterium]|jgi:hypothetical protein|nr:DUF4249 domain-containing protein [Bacteroidia bacterium]
MLLLKLTSHIRLTLLQAGWMMILLTTVQCTEILPPVQDRIGGRVIIYGQITPSAGPHYVRISTTAPYARIPLPEEGATVTIVDDLGNREVYQEEGSGKYRLEGTTVRGATGRSYHIEVTLADGRQYYSEPEEIQVLTARDSGYFEPRIVPGTVENLPFVSNQKLRVYADTEIPAGSPAQLLRWTVEEVYIFEPTNFPDPFNSIPPPCYVFGYPNAQKVSLFDGERLSTNRIEKQLLVERPIDQSFRSRHYFNVSVQSITRRCFTYWTQVNQVSNLSGSIFDTPPATIQGNIYQEGDRDARVLGYFEAIATDTTRFFVVPGYLPVRIPDDCEFLFSRYNYPPECLDCLTLPNSSYIAPPYF